jgi:hypothetical protein
MMLAFLQQPSEIDADLYFLAYQLRKTVAEIQAIPHTEYVTWLAFFKAKLALENMRPGGVE